MDLVQNSLGQVDMALNQVLSNPYVSAFLTMFVILYAALAAPKLPVQVAALFDYTVFKIFVLVMILFVYNYNRTVALVTAVAFFLSLQTLSRYKVNHVAQQVAQVRAVSQAQAQAQAEQHPEEKATGAEMGESVEATAIGSGPGYTPGTADFAGETQVSGLAGRTKYYHGPQGMNHPVGYAGSHAGAELQ